MRGLPGIEAEYAGGNQEVRKAVAFHGLEVAQRVLRLDTPLPQPLIDPKMQKGGRARDWKARQQDGDEGLALAKKALAFAEGAGVQGDMVDLKDENKRGHHVGRRLSLFHSLWEIDILPDEVHPSGS